MLLDHRSLLATLVIACACTKPVAKPPAEPPPPEREHRHPALPPTLEAFHNVLSPVWHATPGPDRVSAACAQAATLTTHATALVTEPAPAEAAGKVEVWKVRTTALASQVGSLTSACSADGKPDVEIRLGSLHEAFHSVSEVVAKMGDHGDHRPAGGTGQHGGPGER